MTCSGSLFFRITDGYKACFGVSDVEKNIERTGTSAMRSVLGSFTYDQVLAKIISSILSGINLLYKVIADRNTLNEKLNSVIGDSILVSFQFKISNQHLTLYAGVELGSDLHTI